MTKSPFSQSLSAPELEANSLPGNWTGAQEALRLSIAEDQDKERRETINRDANAIRRRCHSLLGFVREAWSIVEPGTDFVEGWAIEAVCQHLEAVTRGEIRRLLINIPPRMSKSTMVGVFWPAWEWGPQALSHVHYLATSFSGPNVIRDTTKMRKLIESEWFQRLWGDHVTPTDKWGEKLIVNRQGGQREGRPFSKTTGGGGDRLVIDDPHDTEGAESDVQRTRTVKTFREGLTDRLRNPLESAIVVVMQRLHERDVSGEIIKLGLGYTHLNLPMEFEAVRKDGGRLVDGRCRTYIDGELFFEDPRHSEGDLLFPERFTRKRVEEIKREKGSYAYAGQYQQRPTPREGGLFKREWFEGDGTEGSSKIIPFMPANVSVIVRTWDFAGTAKRASNDPDRTASVLMARTADDRIIIGHADVFQLSPGDTEKRVRATAEADGRTVPVHIPEDPAAGGKYLVRDMIRVLNGFTVHTKRPVGSKEARAGPLATQAEHGNVYLVQGPWVNPWLDEVCNFPNARYDDQVDAASDGYNFLAPVKRDSRYASTGESRTAGLIAETKESELMRRQISNGRNAISAPSRRTGIM